MKPLRQHLRLAAWLMELWRHRSSSAEELPYEWAQLDSRYQSMLQARRRALLARHHELTLCLPELQRELSSQLRSLADQVSALQTGCERHEPLHLGLEHWYQEVLQLHDEFGAVAFLRETGKLRVETPMIILEGVHLGSFAIELVGKQLRQGFSVGCFEIEAVTPNPAASDATVMHPHVKDGELCAGEARTRIRGALAAGRLADAFLMIQSTLQTFNGHSAYVQLSSWDGVCCAECRRTVETEQSFLCDRCEQTLCGRCLSSCNRCNASCCGCCLSACQGCEADCCDECLTLSSCSRGSFYFGSMACALRWRAYQRHGLSPMSLSLT